jgi:hypothetical protein
MPSWDRTLEIVAAAFLGLATKARVERRAVLANMTSREKYPQPSDRGPIRRGGNRWERLELNFGGSQNCPSKIQKNAVGRSYRT